MNNKTNDEIKVDKSGREREENSGWRDKYTLLPWVRRARIIPFGGARRLGEKVLIYEGQVRPPDTGGRLQEAGKVCRRPRTALLVPFVIFFRGRRKKHPQVGQ